MKKYNCMFILFLISFIQASAMTDEYAEYNHSIRIHRSVNKKIKQYFLTKQPSFTDFESVKEYMKTEISWIERKDGTHRIQYHCRYPGCNKIGIGNLAYAASCFLNHYKKDFFSCNCQKTYKTMGSLITHAENCDSFLDQNIEDTSYSDDWEVSDSDIVDPNHECYSEVADFDLEILEKETLHGNSLACDESLDTVGIDPKLIFTHVNFLK